jgi:hypothetical protein
MRLEMMRSPSSRMVSGQRLRDVVVSLRICVYVYVCICMYVVEELSVCVCVYLYVCMHVCDALSPSACMCPSKKMHEIIVSLRICVYVRVYASMSEHKLPRMAVLFEV